MEEALGLAKQYNHPAYDIDRLAAEVSKLTSLNRKPEPTPDYVRSGMYSWESDQRVFWIQYPRGCGPLWRQKDGSWSNFDSCINARSFYPVNIDEAPPDPSLASVNAAEWLDDLADRFRNDSRYARVLRDRIYTNQGRTLEIVRGYFASRDRATVSAFYVHPETGATFTIVMGYATTTWQQDSYAVDSALRSFTVLR